MPALILFLLTLVLVLLLMHGRRGQARRCDWQEVPGGTATLREYKCRTCKVTAYSAGGAPPKECKRGLGGSL